MQLSYKSGDPNYILQDISGTKRINYNECLKELDQIEKEISSLYEDNSSIKNDGKISYKK